MGISHQSGLGARKPVKAAGNGASARRIHMREPGARSVRGVEPEVPGWRCALTLSDGFVIQLVWLLVP